MSEQKLITNIVNTRSDYIKNPKQIEPARSKEFIRQATHFSHISKELQRSAARFAKPNSKQNYIQEDSVMHSNQYIGGHSNPYQVITKEEQPSRNKRSMPDSKLSRAKSAVQNIERRYNQDNEVYGGGGSAALLKGAVNKSQLMSRPKTKQKAARGNLIRNSVSQSLVKFEISEYTDDVKRVLEIDKRNAPQANFHDHKVSYVDQFMTINDDVHDQDSSQVKVRQLLLHNGNFMEGTELTRS